MNDFWLVVSEKKIKELKKCTKLLIHVHFT